MRPSIPATPSEIAPAWLTDTLREAGAIVDASVTNVMAEVIGEERGFTGIVARLVLYFDKPETGAPESLIAKLPLAQRSVASSYRATQAADVTLERRYRERCEREVTFYRRIAPDTALAPRTYAALADLDADRLLLLLDDLSDAEPGDALLGCTVEQALLVVEGIAAFHARWWGEPTLPQMPWLRDWVDDPAASARRFQRQIGPVIGRYGDRLPDHVKGLISRLPAQYEAILSTLNGPPATMIHADLHLDNVMFLTAVDGQTARVIDWQGVSRGAAVVDLATFIVGSLEASARQSADQHLLHRYHEVITEAGVSGYDYHQLLADYRRAMLWQLAGTVGWLARVDLATLQGRERSLVEAIFTNGRLFAALKDHEADLLTL